MIKYTFFAVFILINIGLFASYRLLVSGADLTLIERQLVQVHAGQVMIATVLSIAGYFLSFQFIPVVAQLCLTSKTHLWGKDLLKRQDVKV